MRNIICPALRHNGLRANARRPRPSSVAGPMLAIRCVSAKHVTSNHPSAVQVNSELERAVPPTESQDQTKKTLTVAERDALMVNAWKDREGSLANAEFEDGELEHGLRRGVKANIFRVI